MSRCEALILPAICSRPVALLLATSFHSSSECSVAPTRDMKTRAAGELHLASSESAWRLRFSRVDWSRLAARRQVSASAVVRSSLSLRTYSHICSMLTSSHLVGSYGVDWAARSAA
ncbi:hypothetical protein C1I95_09565 [Micromonospora craterilacus]|uniref:Uncharacterized protein n=1 Tax=Micromonospora craterilacus TaxID=1655439 RepID=A0A2W2FFG7_9ACTN|nr:hypothetical protein C1I95_09565 [Micromonospora craterilacus]